MAGVSAWTDERVGQLRQMWDAGASCSQIAAELGHGITRNAVIGKVHRLGLSGRVKVASNGRSRPQAQQPRAPIQRSRSPSPYRTYPKPAPRPLPPPPQQPPQPKRIDAAIPDVLKEMRRLTIIELGPENCRWPIGDPRDEWFRFCGNDKDMDHSYCPFHKRLSVSPSNNADRNARARQRRAEAVA